MVGGEERPTAWLEAIGADEPVAALRALVPFASALDAPRERQLAMTPCEVVDAALLATGVVDLACRWGAAAARLHPLEAFRGVACSYEGECARLRLAATLGGLVAWLRTRKEPRPRGGGDAVSVMSYHKAKGLEWPVVVLAQLESAPRPRLFAPAVEVDGVLDWRKPLAGRWIRYWPWPYGKQKKDVHLDAAAAATGTGCRAADKARDEAVRVLYVGMTRARDHLIMSRTAAPAAWLAMLATLDTGVNAHVVLPMLEDRPAKVGDRASRALPAPRRRRNTCGRARRRPLPRDDPPGCLPSSVAAAAERRRPGRLSRGTVTRRFGRAPAHRRLAGDGRAWAGRALLHRSGQGDRDGSVRLARAHMTLDRWDVSPQLGAESLVEAADRLWSFLARRYPDARLRREVPVFAPFGTQVVASRVDLLVEKGDRFAVVDHKSFPGREALWDAKAVAVGPQLVAYARAIALATGATCDGLLVHMPLVGAIVEMGATALPEAMTVAD